MVSVTLENGNNYPCASFDGQTAQTITVTMEGQNGYNEVTNENNAGRGTVYRDEPPIVESFLVNIPGHPEGGELQVVFNRVQ